MLSERTDLPADIVVIIGVVVGLSKESGFGPGKGQVRLCIFTERSCPGSQAGPSFLLRKEVAPLLAGGFLSKQEVRQNLAELGHKAFWLRPFSQASPVLASVGVCTVCQSRRTMRSIV